MMLLVDAGNTRIKWRVVENRVRIAAGAVLTREWMQLAAAWRSIPIARAVLSCVADAAVRTGLAQVLYAKGVAAYWLEAERENHGVINHYTTPQKLGADRYAALIAVAHMQLGDCVVASIGTATTVDRLDRNGAFLGGIILPGPDLMRSALMSGTSQIEPRMQINASLPAFSLNLTSPPRDTQSAVSAGIALAQVGAIRAMCVAQNDNLGDPPKLILTGGARNQIRSALSFEFTEIEDLALEGLAWVALESTCAS